MFFFLKFQLQVYLEGVRRRNIELRNSSLQVGFDPLGQFLQTIIDVCLAVCALLQVRLDIFDLRLTCRDMNRIKIKS